MIVIRPSTLDDGDTLIDIWRRAVDATHTFLTPEDLNVIEDEVKSFLPTASSILAVDSRDNPLGFMLLDKANLGKTNRDAANIEALFIDPDYHGIGIGRELISYAAVSYSVLTTDVNEQNMQARGFYSHLGFIEIGRSALDRQGRNYPLLHLKLNTAVLL